VCGAGVAQRLVEAPDGLALRDTVALLADGRTALSLIRRARPREGETVLVEAAAGGVGTLLVTARAQGRRAGRDPGRVPAGQRTPELDDPGAA